MRPEWNRRPRRTPSFDRLEARDLPSAALYLAAARLRLAQAPVVSQAEAIGAPTPREARRERFVAKFVASYFTQPPQLVGESARVVFVSNKGGSNQFLHGAAMAAINTTADPENPIVRSVAAIYPQNVATTGSQLDLNLRATSSSPGLPTRLTWDVNGNSAGLYAGAVATSPGSLVIRYSPQKRLPGGFVSGTATLVFRGTVLTTGIGNIARAGL